MLPRLTRLLVHTFRRCFDIAGYCKRVKLDQFFAIEFEQLVCRKPNILSVRELIWERRQDAVFNTGYCVSGFWPITQDGDLFSATVNSTKQICLKGPLMVCGYLDF